MNRTNTGAGQHRNGSFWHHWHIDSNNITFLNTQFFQHIGKLAYIMMKLFVCNSFGLIRIIAFPDNRSLITAFCQMAIQTVCCKVQCTIFKPADTDMAGIKRGILHRFIRFNPINNLAMLTPEFIWVLHRLLIILMILFWVYQGMLCNCSWNRVLMYLAHHHSP
ncbi:Uncharacterised protein [Yersinia enterocolitica]|nr:Uncharacterised protein [Yersinia enterocolitica]